MREKSFSFVLASILGLRIKPRKCVQERKDLDILFDINISHVHRDVHIQEMKIPSQGGYT